MMFPGSNYHFNCGMIMVRKENKYLILSRNVVRLLGIAFISAIKSTTCHSVAIDKIDDDNTRLVSIRSTDPMRSNDIIPGYII